MPEQNEVQLLTKARFLPLFLTQFLGALNDNFFKNALIMLIAFNTTKQFLPPDTLINLSAALFIVPFFLFSAFAGQIADKYEKSKLISLIKMVEVILALLALVGFIYKHIILLLISLFLLGTHSTFFGPLKYSILPQHLKESELVGGNGLIQMGTFIAILIGTIFGGILIGIPNQGLYWVSFGILFIACLGLLISLFIPMAAPTDPHLKLDWNLFRQTFIILKEIFKDKTIFLAVTGISWFWLFGSVFLTQIANFTRIHLGGNEQVATLQLVNFSIGIGIGSACYEWLANKKINLTLVVWASLGLSFFALDLSLNSWLPSPQTYNALTFLRVPQHWRILMDGMLMGVCGGIYIVPLYTLVQKASNPARRSRMIAGNNIMNALLMVFGAILAILFLGFGLSIPALFVCIAFLNLGIGLLLFLLRKTVLLKP